MKKKSPPYLVIGAVLLGVIAAAGMFKLIQDKDAETQAKLDAQAADFTKQIQDLKNSQPPSVSVPSTPTNMRQVLYSTQAIEPGEKISPSYFEPKLTPDDVLPDAYVPANSADVTGMVAIRPIEKGDPLTHHNIGSELDHLSSRLHHGMRSISLPIFNADYNDTGGFLTDGDTVDLFYTTSTLNTNLIIRTQLVMQNVPVLYVPNTESRTDEDVGLKVAAPPGGPIAVTFEVTPEQAQALIFMSGVKNGKFSMILRPRKEPDPIVLKPIEPDDFPDLDFKKIEKMDEAALAKAKALQAQIDAANPKPPAPGTTNETKPPTP